MQALWGRAAVESSLMACRKRAEIPPPPKSQRKPNFLPASFPPTRYLKETGCWEPQPRAAPFPCKPTTVPHTQPPASPPGTGMWQGGGRGGQEGDPGARWMRAQEGLAPAPVRPSGRDGHNPGNSLPAARGGGTGGDLRGRTSVSKATSW